MTDTVRFAMRALGALLIALALIPGGVAFAGGASSASEVQRGSSSPSPTPEFRPVGVVKVITSGPDDSVSFTVQVTCELDGELVLDEGLIIGGDGSQALTAEVPIGSVCTVEEADLPLGWVLVSIDPAEIVVSDEEQTIQLFTVENARVRDLEIVKQLGVQGDSASGALQGGPATFTVDVNCTHPDFEDISEQVQITVDADNGSSTGTVEGLPVGSSCTVTEPSLPAGWELVGIEPAQPVEITATEGNEPIQVIVTNRRGAPSLNVAVREPVCDNDVPYLRYEVQVSNSTDTTVDITWINPSGTSVVYPNQPLSGRVLWAGAFTDSQGNGTDWPGWRQLADGTWVQGDEFDWVRPQVNVQFEVNPTQVVTVAYPPSSPLCNPNPENPPRTALPATGANGTSLGLVAAVLGVTGAALLVVSRRRPPQAD